MNARDSWTTVTPYEGAVDRDLPEIWSMFKEDGSFELYLNDWAEQPDVDELTIYGRVEGGEVVFKEMTIVSPSITADTVRNLRVGTIRNAFATSLKRHPKDIDLRTQITPDQIPDGDWDSVRSKALSGQEEAIRAKQKLRSSGRLTGRPALSDDHLRHVAETYIEEATRSPDDFIPAVGQRLESELDIKEIKESRLKNWITKTRNTGWLAPTTQGKPNPAPGPRLLAYWEEHGKEGTAQ